MPNGNRGNPSPKPVAIVIAANMRMATQKGANATPTAHVRSALRKASNSSPVARASFKDNRAAVKSAKPHLQALAKRDGKGLMSSLRHGVGAMQSMRAVTKGMAKPSGATKPGSMKTESNVALSGKAQKHVDGIEQAMQKPNPGLFSALGQGVKLMREMRKTTREMKRGPTTPPQSGAGPNAPDGHSRALSDMPAHGSGGHGPATGGKPASPGLFSSLGQGVRMLREMRGVTREMKKQQAFPTLDAALPQSRSPSPSRDSPLAIMLLARRNGRTFPGE